MGFLFILAKKVGFYIDGFNFYHAIHDLRLSHLKWMSYWNLATCLIRRDEEIGFVKLFSAYADFRPSSKARHALFNVAMEYEGCCVILGKFKAKSQSCKACHCAWVGHEEKETDVNIALHLLDDCYQGLIDVAYILTTDSDLAPAAAMVRKRFPSIDLVTVATPGRSHSKEMLHVCGRKAKVTQSMVETCLLPEVITDASGSVVVKRPYEYAPPV